MVVYFSGTGNSRFAAEFLAKQLSDELLDAGQRIKAKQQDQLHSDRPWVFVAPIYAWRMAGVMADYIRTAELTGSRDAYFVLTCGGEIGSADAYAAQLCEEKSLRFCGALEVVMPSNYLVLGDTPGIEEARAAVAKAKPVLEQGGNLIQADEPFPARKSGLLDKLKSGIVNEGFYRFYVKADPFYTTDACTGCSTCVEVCPLNNIALTDNRPVWGKCCTHCMACICGCPAAAIEYGKQSRGRVRYQCPED